MFFSLSVFQSTKWDLFPGVVATFQCQLWMEWIIWRDFNIPWLEKWGRNYFAKAPPLFRQFLYVNCCVFLFNIGTRTQHVCTICPRVFCACALMTLCETYRSFCSMESCRIVRIYVKSKHSGLHNHQLKPQSLNISSPFQKYFKCVHNSKKAGGKSHHAKNRQILPEKH